ncbi:MAG: chemotaxis protein CheC [Lachnospiraceae bacterium]|jgi:chemotaxis protein CheC|nr:chemotaxis protein CheC [Lachnospiraceae bacterium]MBP5249982.1 chemotaxis protein CheC [Lachnospiraceae bacterium]
MSQDNMNEMEFDVLREIGNIGSGHAATALAKMLNQKVDIKVPKAVVCDFNALCQMVGGEEKLVIGILLTLDGDVDGMMMFIMDLPSAYSLLRKMMFVDLKDEDELNEMHESALHEIGNIITGAYLSSLSDLTKLKINASIPYMSRDMAGAVLSVPAIEFGKLGDKAVMIETEFDDSGEDTLNGYFLLIPTMESYGKIMSSLGIC